MAHCGTSSQTENVTMTTRTTKLYGKDLSVYDNVDIEELLTQLTPEQLEQLNRDVDPDDNLLPPSERCRDQTSKTSTGPLNRKSLLDYLERSAREEEDWPERKPFQSGMVRGKIWTPKAVPKPPPSVHEEVALDVGDEYEQALSQASEEELVDLAAILGLHSMMNQDQFYASITNKKAMFGKFESIVKATQPKALPLLPDNDTNVDKTIEQVGNNDPKMKALNWNNIKNISLEKFNRLFKSLKNNSHLEQLSLANTRLTDSAAKELCGALEENKSLKVLNVESNYISPPIVCDLVRSLLNTGTVVEFRATNQKPEVLGVKTEMEIAKLVEENKNLLRLGLSFDVPDARIRVHHHLQQNNDNLRLKRIGSLSSMPNAF